MQETQAWSLGWDDPLEKGMVTHSSILSWRISWTEEPSGLQSMGLQRVGHDWATNIFTLEKQRLASKECSINISCKMEAWGGEGMGWGVVAAGIGGII